jgi:hypothetical protein
MLLIVIILSFLLLASVGINFWLILYTIPWKESTIDFFYRKYRMMFNKRWNELTEGEQISAYRAYVERGIYHPPMSPETLNKAK